MNEKELKTFTNTFLKQLEENQLGCFSFFISQEGGIAVTVLPEWSVLKYKGEKLYLDANENNNMMDWLDRAAQTLSFLEVYKKHCEESSVLFNSLYKILNEALESFLADSKIEESKSRLLH